MRTTPAMPALFVAAFFCLFTLSCKKDHDGQQPSGDDGTGHYSPATTLRALRPVMYTGTDTIRDQHRISEYLKRRNIEDMFSFVSPIQGDNFSAFSMLFKEGNKIQLGFRDAEIIERSASGLLIAEMDSAVSQPVGDGKAKRLISLIPQHSPRTVCPDFYSTPCKYRELTPIMVTDGKYFIPYVVAYVSVDEMVAGPLGMVNSSTYSSTQGIMQLNSAVISELDADGGINRHDTLVVQVLTREMLKQ
ncbi:hypothetical protein [uncultured Chitinophaga sp.]|jgi:hypothetical protein|uniref:hypothetical protein n=1 Tax=uncultured Chitinophaga sp. TaxID=339340 RepID=UPI00260E3862|nr:hypothetical protein [uncultured Chitinophaga sp.]